jgi:hypothetical protein
MTARRLLPFGIAILWLLAVACGGGGSSAGGGGTNTWVGKVEETDAFVAILIQGTGRFVYVTDGKDLFMLFRGNIGETGADNFFVFRDDQNRILNVQAPQGNTYTGIITVSAGQHLRFSAAPAKGEAGLYRAKDATGQSNWIVLEDGSVRGAKVGTDGKIEGLATRGGVKWTDPSTDP